MGDLRRALPTTVFISLLAVATSFSGQSAGAGVSSPAQGVGLHGNVADPVVTPTTALPGVPLGGIRYDVSEFGYQEREYFLAGIAKTFPPTAPSRVPYRTRMLVWTPTDASRFNGTTIVEWAEVSDYANFELTVELNYESQYLISRGYAFALVSTQQGGVCGRNAAGECSAMSLRGANPSRYGSLNITADNYSFDVFSQALQAIKHPKGVAPLGKLKTRTVIATGFQESVDKYFVNRPPSPLTAARPLGDYGPLNAYIESGADDDARVVDAFLIDGAAPAVVPARYRVPTLHYLDESAVRWTPTPDAANHVTWEVTGAAHVDRWEIAHINFPSTPPHPLLTKAEELALIAKHDNYGQLPDAGASTCSPSPSTGSLYPRRFTLDAAVADLRTWVQTGRRAPAAPRVQRVSTLPSSPTMQLVRDGDGNAIGGLRSPIIDVPVAGYDGNACIASGTTTQFSPARLHQLYPTHRSYVQRLLASTNHAVRARYLRCRDAVTLMHAASTSTIGGADAFTAVPRCVVRRR